jgi:hypothetical protein
LEGYFPKWSQILEGEEVNDATHVKCQLIWLNPSIKINEKWQEKGFFFINDIMKTNGNGLMSVEELDLKYQITNTCMFYNSKESGRFGTLKSDSTHHFFRNACTKSGSLRFSQFSGC